MTGLLVALTYVAEAAGYVTLLTGLYLALWHATRPTEGGDR